jgi:hypothetical protein
MQRQFPAAPTQGTTAAYLDQDQASEYLAEKGLKIAPKTFGKLRVIGGGPRYRKFGRKPLYAPLDLDEWVEKKLSEPLRSTSEATTEPSPQLRPAGLLGHNGGPPIVDAPAIAHRPRSGRPRIVRDHPAPAAAERRAP